MKLTQMSQGRMKAAALFVVALIYLAAPSEALKTMLVGVTVTDLRAQPQKMQQLIYRHDPLELSQLVFNEYVIVLNESNGWSYVEAVQQPNYVNGKWGPYLGYIASSDLVPVPAFRPYNLVVSATVANVFKRSCHKNGCLPNEISVRLSIGTWLEAIGAAEFGWQKIRIASQNNQGFVEGWLLANQVRPLNPVPTGDKLRQALVDTSKQMLGWYYFWGGRSAFIEELWDSKTVLTGVDCSGLVGTVYRTQGILLPRDAQPMFVFSKNVTGGPGDLKAGDLFFFASPQRPDYMYHVMMYIGNDLLVESATNSTRIMPVKDNFGVSIKDLTWGHQTPDGSAVVYWGRVIQDRDDYYYYYDNLRLNI